MLINLIIRLFSRYAALAGCLAVIALIWTSGPYLRIGDSAPFGSLAAKWIATLIVLLGWGIYQIVRMSLDKRRSERLASSLVESDRASSPDEIRRKFETVLNGVRKARHEGKPLRLQSMPWYLIIGPPGSGKTSALRSSGLKFPARDVIGAEAVRGVGGTRNCAWWVSTEAVLVDTAGRYTTQTSADGSDRIEWEAFLDILKNNRPKQPINGLIVLMGAEVLCNTSEREFGAHVAAVTERVREMTDNFSITLPIYVCVSKMDRIPGFLEVFEDAPENERRRALGIGLGSRDIDRDPGEIAVEALQTWLRELEYRTQERMVNERHRARLETILGFSAGINSLSRRIGQLVSRLANAGEGEHQTDVRGVYFCSAMQTGEMLDRIVAAFGIGFAKAPDSEGEQADGAGRAYFIEGIFRDVAFPEKGLAGSDFRALTLSNRRYWITFAATVLLAAVLIALLSGSFLGNRGLTRDADAALPPMNAAGEVQLEPGPLALSALDAVSDVQTLVHPPAEDRPLRLGMGLAQAPSIDGGAGDAFRRLADNGLVPYVARLHESAVLDPQYAPAIRFELLKSYMMIAGTAPARIDPQLVAASTALLVARVPGIRAEDPERAARHMAEAVNLGALAGTPPAGLVERARALFGSDPLTLLGDLAVDRASTALDQSGLPATPFSLADALGPQASLVFQFDRTLEAAPIFTNAGAAFFDRQVDTVASDLAGEMWVLGTESADTAESAARIRNAAVKAYVNRYTDVWDRILASPQVNRASGHEMRAFAGAIAGRESPILRFLKAIEPHLVISAGTTASALEDPNAARTPTSGGSSAADRLRQLAGGPAEVRTDVPILLAADEIRHYYRDLGDMISGSSQPSLITLSGVLGQIEAELGGATDDELMLAMGGDPTSTAMSALQSIREMQRLSGQFPDPVQRWITTALASARQSVGRQAVQQVAQTVSRQLETGCPASILEKYPFRVGASDEVSINELRRAFGSSGFFASFFDENLARNVDRSSDRWRFINPREPNGGIAASDLESFRLAESFSDRLGLDSGGSDIRYSARVTHLSPTARVQVIIGDVELDYAHGPIRPVSGQWRLGSDSRFEVRFSSISGAGGEASTSISGGWALLRAIDRFGSASAPLRLSIEKDGQQATLELDSAQLHALFARQDWRSIRCPR